MVRVNLTAEQIEVALQIANAIANSAGVPVSTGQRAINMLKLDNSLSGSASCIPTSEAVQKAIDTAKDEIIAAVENLLKK